MMVLLEILKVGLFIGLFYLLYKSGILNKIYNTLNLVAKSSKEQQKKEKERKRFIKSLIKQRKINEEI